jgi:hypothetical protein
MDAPLCAVNRGMSGWSNHADKIDMSGNQLTWIPPILGFSTHDGSYETTVLHKVNDRWETEVIKTSKQNNPANVIDIPVAGNGWCMYNSILKSFGIPTRPELAQCVARSIVDTFKNRYKGNNEGGLNKEGLDLIQDFAFNDLLSVPNQKETVPGTFSYESFDIKKNITDPYIFRGVYLKGITTVDAYFSGLVTPITENDPSTGPRIWPDIRVFADVILDLFGPFLIFTDSLLSNKNSIPNTVSYFALFSRPVRDNVTPKPYHMVFRNNGNHFNNLDLSGEYVELGREIQTIPNVLPPTILTCLDKFKLLPQEKQAQSDDTAVAEAVNISNLNGDLEKAIQEYAEDSTKKQALQTLFTAVYVKYIKGTHSPFRIRVPERIASKIPGDNYLHYAALLWEKYNNICASIPDSFTDDDLHTLDILLYLIHLNDMNMNDYKRLNPDGSSAPLFQQLLNSEFHFRSEISMPVCKIDKSTGQEQNNNLASELPGQTLDAHAQLETAALAERATAVLGEAQGAHALLMGDTAALAKRAGELLDQAKGAQTALQGIVPAIPLQPVIKTEEQVANKSQLQTLLESLGQISLSPLWKKLFGKKPTPTTPESVEGAAKTVSAAIATASNPDDKKQLEKLLVYLGELAFQMRKMKESQTQLAVAASDKDHAAIAALEAKIDALEKKIDVPPPAPPPPQIKEVGMPAFSPAVAEKLKEYLYPGQPAPTPPEEKKEEIDLSEATVVVDVSGVPGWATDLFTDTNFKAIPATCSKSTFLPNGCAAQGVLNHIRELESLKKSNRFASSGPMKRFEELQAKLVSEPDAGKKAAIQKEIAENYAHGLVAINIEGETQYLPIPNPYKAHKYRSRIVSFANPAGLTDISGEEATMKGMNLNIIKTGIFPQEVLADKAITTALLRAMWACRNDATATSTDCYPLQVLGELREFQAYKGQSDAHARAKKLLDDKSWPLVETMTRSLKGAIPHVFMAQAPPTAVSSLEYSTAASDPLKTATGPPIPTTTPRPTMSAAKPLQPRPSTLLPSSFGGGLSMSNFLVPNTFGFAPLLPVKTA